MKKKTEKKTAASYRCGPDCGAGIVDRLFLCMVYQSK